MPWWDTICGGQMTKRAVLTAFAFLISVSPTLACGTERWSVKVGLDQDADKVSLTPKEISIEDLSSIHAPEHPATRDRSRFPEEKNTYQISGILSVIKKEK